MITYVEFRSLLRINRFSSYAIFLFNLINLAKVASDQLFLFLFQYTTVKYNLQADLTEDYRDNIDRRYKDRLAMFFIMIIRAGNALMFISLPLIFFYKIRFLPGLSHYVPRFFLALKSILQIILIFMTIFSFLSLADGILDGMKYHLGNTEKERPPKESENIGIFNFVRVMDYVNLIYRSTS